MKIKSHIQKIFAVLFLLAFFSSCTDEVMDGGGSGTTPVEAGKPVNVKFALGKAGEQTVVTKSGDVSSASPKINDLLFLQYKKEGNAYSLCYTWYMASELVEFGSKSSAIEGVKLLSGNDYIVYILSNVKEANLISMKDIIDPETDLGNNTTTGTGCLNPESDSFDRFLTPKEVKKMKMSSDAPSGNEVMLANAQNEARNEMLTIMGEESESFFVNPVITEEIGNVTIVENSTLKGIFYVPYSSVSLAINTSGLNDGVSIKLNSVKIKNCTKAYYLANGYSIAGDQETLTEDYSIFNGDEISLDKSNATTFSGPFWIYENMAGVLSSSKQSQKAPVEGTGNQYTYIEVKGQYSSDASRGDITYRFILGKDAVANCNVERNVKYNVTMTLKGNGGKDEASWRVDYTADEKPEPEDKPVIVTPTGLGKLDAHATLCNVKLTFSKIGKYYILPVAVGEGAPTSVANNKSKDKFRSEFGAYFGLLKYQKSSIPIKWKDGKNGYFEVTEKMLGKEYTLSFVQMSWFEYKKNMDSHKSDKSDAVAKAMPHSYNLYIAYDSEGKDLTADDLSEPIEVTQYPPLVLAKLKKASDTYSIDNAKYIERFWDNINDDDDKETDDLVDDWDDDDDGNGWDDDDEWDSLFDNDHEDQDVKEAFKSATDFKGSEYSKDQYYILNGSSWGLPTGITGYQNNLKADSYYKNDTEVYKPRHYYDDKD